MEKIVLTAHPRTEVGRHAAQLRRQGFVPAVLYGRTQPSINLAMEEKALTKIWRQAGRSHLVDLNIEGAKPAKALIREYQLDPRSARPLHVDFLAVKLTEKLQVDVPVILIGESPAVSELKIGQLLHIITSLKVECLPNDIPAQLTVDISGLNEIDQGITVAEIELTSGVSLVGTALDELVVKVAPLRVQAVETEAESDPSSTAEAATTEAVDETKQ